MVSKFNTRTTILALACQIAVRSVPDPLFWDKLRVESRYSSFCLANFTVLDEADLEVPSQP